MHAVHKLGKTLRRAPHVVFARQAQTPNPYSLCMRGCYQARMHSYPLGSCRQQDTPSATRRLPNCASQYAKQLAENL